MSEHYETIAKIIYKECIRWVVDFIEDEITFPTMLDRFQENYNKFSILEDIDLLDLLHDEKELELLEINVAIEDRIDAVQFNDDSYTDDNLKQTLAKLINNKDTH